MTGDVDEKELATRSQIKTSTVPLKFEWHNLRFFY